ncbi:Hypothetical_protein [Hexamita inflata]|uniref:Hypothetical_protein n=1 Tax=Hexamita inflata TaxID=28002 RepID=A0AA86U7L7_9EUKA|nr:Hypothetical protein HINF_LOCUS31949 [Hexamita inflata]
MFAIYVLQLFVLIPLAKKLNNKLIISPVLRILLSSSIQFMFGYTVKSKALFFAIPLYDLIYLAVGWTNKIVAGVACCISIGVLFCTQIYFDNFQYNFLFVALIILKLKNNTSNYLENHKGKERYYKIVSKAVSYYY